MDKPRKGRGDMGFKNKAIHKLLLLIIAVCFALPITAFADSDGANTSYTVANGRMRIGIADGTYAYVITRDNMYYLGSPSAVDSNTKSYMLQNNIYLDAITEDQSYEFMVVAVPFTALTDLRQLSDKELESFISEYDDALVQSGAVNLNTVIRSTSADEPKYLESTFECPLNGTSYRRTSYYTIYDGRAVTLTFTDYAGAGNPFGLSEIDQLRMIDFTEESKYTSPGDASAEGNSGFKASLVRETVLFAFVVGGIIFFIVRANRAKHKSDKQVNTEKDVRGNGEEEDT